MRMAEHDAACQQDEKAERAKMTGMTEYKAQTHKDLCTLYDIAEDVTERACATGDGLMVITFSLSGHSFRALYSPDVPGIFGIQIEDAMCGNDHGFGTLVAIAEALHARTVEKEEAGQ